MPLWRDTMSVMTVGQCPVCFELTYLSLIEPHATRNDVEWRTFACSKCGPVKAVLMPIKGYRPEIPVRPSKAVSYTHLRAHETGRNLVCRLLLEKKKQKL